MRCSRAAPHPRWAKGRKRMYQEKLVVAQMREVRGSPNAKPDKRSVYTYTSAVLNTNNTRQHSRTNNTRQHSRLICTHDKGQQDHLLTKLQATTTRSTISYYASVYATMNSGKHWLYACRPHTSQCHRREFPLPSASCVAGAPQLFRFLLLLLLLLYCQSVSWKRTSLDALWCSAGLSESLPFAARNC